MSDLTFLVIHRKWCYQFYPSKICKLLVHVPF